MLNRKPLILRADLHPRNPLQITPQIADWRCCRSRRGNDTFTHLICLSRPTPSISDNAPQCGCPSFGAFFVSNRGPASSAGGVNLGGVSLPPILHFRRTMASAFKLSQKQEEN